MLDPSGGVVDLTGLSPDELRAQRSGALLLIDRLALRAERGRARLVEAVSSAFALGDGRLVLIDADGDVAFAWYSEDRWGFIGGTGKFEGIIGEGTYKTATAWPDGKFVNVWEITWSVE